MTRPRIALDLHTLTRLMQGSRTYAWNLALRLPGLDPGSDFFFHLPGVDGDEARRLQAPNVFLRETPGSRAARLLTFGGRLRLDRADLLHCQYLAPPLAPCPVVLSLHDVLHESHPGLYPGAMRFLMRRLYPGAARRAAVVLTCSEHSRGEIVRRYGVAEERVEAIPLAADESFRPARNDAERETARRVAARYGVTGRYVLFVGRVEPKKNISGLIRAFLTLVEDAGHDLSLVVAGMVDPLFRAGLTADPPRRDPRIRLIGRVDPDDLPHLYRGAELFAFASHGEGFGLPPLEALASGVPVVCADTTSLPEVVGDAALLVAPGDEAAMARAMRRMLADRDLRAGFIARGLERSRRFSWDLTARATLAAYHRVLARARRAR